MSKKKFRLDPSKLEGKSAFDKLQSSALQNVGNLVIGGKRAHGQTHSQSGSGHSQTHSETAFN